MSKVDFYQSAESVALFSVCAARDVFVVYFMFFGAPLLSGKGCNCMHTKSGNIVYTDITAVTK